MVVKREVLHRSPILLTPYRPDGLIDVGQLETFVHAAYADAGLERADVDTGAVILTGAALERANARGVADLFAGERGKDGRVSSLDGSAAPTGAEQVTG